MFEGFASVWTPVAMAEDLKADRPLPVKVAGEPLVLFRGPGGAPAALLDRCPHRGVALSQGKVKDGCIECPFHGWKLEGSGQVCDVPWNPDAKLSTLRGVSVPAREVGGQIWVFSAPVAEAPGEPQVDEALLRPGVRVSGFAVDWKTHWTRAMENMLDSPHLPFVHKKTIGRQMVGRSHGRMDIDIETRPWGASSRPRIDGKESPGQLDFRWPNQMVLHIPVPGKLFRMMVACIPVDATTTRMLLVVVRDFMTTSLLDGFFHRTNARIALEDQAILESSFPAEVPPAGDERSVRTDAFTLLFRKRYFAEVNLPSVNGGASQRPHGRRATCRGSAGTTWLLPGYLLGLFHTTSGAVQLARGFIAPC